MNSTTETYEYLADARVVKDGRTVRVVKGRKVPIGTEGTMVWGEWRRYGRDVSLRIGILDADGVKHYTAASNVVILHPEHGVLTPSNV